MIFNIGLKLKINNSQKILFITYGDKDFDISKKHLLNLAKKSEIFSQCISYSYRDLSSSFKKKYSKILSEKRGGGFWIWKHHIIKESLDLINENDLIVYCDAGTSFNYHAKSRFMEYVEILNSSIHSNFRIESEPHHLEKEWTTKELFNYFKINSDSKIGNSTQYEGGHMIFKSNKETRDYLNEYEEILRYDQKLITDFYNSKNQQDFFIENRHDQSIFSLLSKTRGCEKVQNETKFHNRKEEQYKYPFLSVRKKGHGPKDKLKYAINYKNFQNTPNYFQ